MGKLPLAGQVALVTGAAKRIGRSIALRLAAEGADVALNYLSSADDAQSVAEEIRHAGRRAFLAAADVSRPDAVASLFRAVDREFGRLDILVNNAGVNTLHHRVPIDQFPRSEWDRIVQVDLTGLYLVSKAYCATRSTVGSRWARSPFISNPLAE